MKIVGITRKSGVFEGRTYDNIIVQCTEPYETGKGFGSKVKSFKVKAMVLEENLQELTDKSLAALVGQEAEFYFDEYQAVKYVDVQPPRK